MTEKANRAPFAVTALPFGFALAGAGRRNRYAWATIRRAACSIENAAARI
jgi:hypothetical protein